MLKNTFSATNQYAALLLLALSGKILAELVAPSPTVNAAIILEAVTFAWGPLIYFMVASATTEQQQLSMTNWWHFLPLLLATLIFGVLYFNHQGVEYRLLSTLASFQYTQLALSLLANASFAIYLATAIKKLRQHQYWLEGYHSAIDLKLLNWLHHLVTGLLIIFTSYLLLFVDIFPTRNALPPVYQQLWQLAALLWLTAIALNALLKPTIFNSQNIIRQQKADSSPQCKQLLDQEQLIQYSTRLGQLMKQQKPYLNPNLGLVELAEQLGIPHRTLSYILNNELKQSFYHYINQHRIEAVKAMLCNEQNRHVKLEGIALDAGFRSSSTFNRLFKQHTKLTPQQYRNQMLS